MQKDAALRTVDEVVLVTGRPLRTIRNWAADGKIRSACDLRTRQLLVSLADAHELSQQAGRRRRSTQHAA